MDWDVLRDCVYIIATTTVAWKLWNIIKKDDEEEFIADMMRQFIDLRLYNKKRRDLGMEPVSEVDRDWERVLFLWKYRIDGEIYLESVKKSKG